MEHEDSLIMGDEDLCTIPEKESDEFIKSSVDDLVPIPRESKDTSDSDKECNLPFCDNSVIFSSPLFNVNDDFTSSNDESLPEEDVQEENFKIYSNHLFDFDDKYISSDVNPLFNEVLKDIETKESYVSNLDEPALLVTPFSNANEDECFDPGGDIDKIDAFLDIDVSTDIKDGSRSLPSNTVANPKGELKAITTRSGIFLDGPSVYTPPHSLIRRVPLILGRPFLWTARALIDVNGEEMILQSINLISVFNDSSEDFLENLFSTNQPSGNPIFSSHPELTSPKVKDDIFDPEGGNVLPEKLLDLDSTKDLHPPLHVNPLIGSTTFSSFPNKLLEKFADELALITFPLEYDDDLQFDIESDLKEIEYLLHHDPIKDIDSSLKDSIDQSNLADLNDNLVDSMPEMFIDEHALDYSSHPIFDEYDDDLFEVESDIENFYDDPFDSKGEKIKEFTLLIDELGLPCDFLPSFEYDSFIFEDFF
nr:hypothetical protein [Tanacetum cinerariifolium]